MKVIPAIDLLDGKVVRLQKGDFEDRTVYSDSPLEVARTFMQAGFHRIHIVDLNGAREGRLENLEHIREINESLELSIQAGGGIRSLDDAVHLLEQGISNIICSSFPIQNREEWYSLLEQYTDRVILGMDLKNGQIAYQGWEETTEQVLESFLNPMIARGLTEVLCTDISRDGTLEGPNTALYKELKSRFPALHFIASGGVSGYQDLVDLEQAEVYGVVVGRAYYEDKISLKEMGAFREGQ